MKATRKAERLAFMLCAYSIATGACNNFLLGSAAPAEDRRNRAQQDLQIEPRRPVVDILEIELHPAVEVDLVAAADLPQTRQSRLHRQPPAMPPVVRRHFLRNRRPRADETHVALEHVPELRELVERELAQHAADRRHARI